MAISHLRAAPVTADGQNQWASASWFRPEDSQTSSPNARIRPWIQADRPGNRLRMSDDGKRMELEPHSFPYAVGKLVGPLLRGAGQAFASLAGRVSWMIPGWSPGKPQLLSAASDCFGNITAKFPGMDEDSQSIVETLCGNNKTALTVSRVSLNIAGIQGIGAALAQNTALATFRFSGTYCDTATFATAITTALKANRNLQHLSLDVVDTGPSYYRPAPMASQAVQTFFRNLQCFSLRSLDLGLIDISGSAQTLATTFQNYPYSPLSRLTFTWQTLMLNDQQFSVIAEGLGASRCITEFGNGNSYASLSEQMMLSLFEAVRMGQTVSVIDAWCPPYSFNDTERQTILDAVNGSSCFLYYSARPTSCFPEELADAIRNITQGREACTRNASCDVLPPDCKDPTAAPSTAPSAEPSAAPTSSPSAAPSTEPSLAPSPAPTPNATAAAATVSESQPYVTIVPVAVGGGIIGAFIVAFLKMRKKQREAAVKFKEENQETTTIGEDGSTRGLDGGAVPLATGRQSSGRDQLPHGTLQLVPLNDSGRPEPRRAPSQPRTVEAANSRKHVRRAVALDVWPEQGDRGASPAPQEAPPPSPAVAAPGEEGEEYTLDLGAVQQPAPLTPSRTSRPAPEGEEELQRPPATPRTPGSKSRNRPEYTGE